MFRKLLHKVRVALAGHHVYRDAETGRFVSEAYAEANPRTTIRQRVW